MRHSATSALLERRDVIVVASVSCIYSLGSPEEYKSMALSLRPGMTLDRDQAVASLVDMQYDRNDLNFIRGTFRVKGEVLEIFPASEHEHALRLEFFDDELERIVTFDVVTGDAIASLSHAIVYPATHYATSRDKMEATYEQILADMEVEAADFEARGKLIEAQRIRERVNYDVEMMREIGYCSGIENYSRYFDGRQPGEAAYTLLDFFPDDYLLFIDESHVTVPQIRGMFGGDRSRKDMLVSYGFRLKAAYDNRPLNFEEFEARMGQTVYMSATPAEFEMARAGQVAEQLIRPTGLVDPEVVLRPVKGQIDDLIGEIRKTTAAGYRTLVTTLTKRMAESLTDYLTELDLRVRYLHSDVDTLERMALLHDLRVGEFDVLVGINLLREGLDLPEVALVAILDADKEGFLRSDRSLIQTIGRAARNAEGRVILYGDVMTDSMKRALDETNRRRRKQIAYNESHGIVPKTIVSALPEDLMVTKPLESKGTKGKAGRGKGKKDTGYRVDQQVLPDIETVRTEMYKAAAALDFERAAQLRDQLLELESLMGR